MLALNEVSPNGLLAKGLYLFKTKNFVAARDYLNRGRCYSLPFLHYKIDSKINPCRFALANSNSTFNAACLKTLADTHLKLHAFTLAEYCYVTSKTENIDRVRCLVEQRIPTKSKEALWLSGAMYSTVEDDTKAELIELEAKYIPLSEILLIHIQILDSFAERFCIAAKPN